MELFKTNLLKKEFERFQNEELINVLECGLCQRNSCEWDRKFKVTCDRCKRLGVKFVVALILPRKICLKTLIKREKITLRTL